MRILAFGEVMMRLTPPNYKLIQQTDTLDLMFTGTGLNILSSLAHFNYETYMLTQLPNNQVGLAAAGFMRKLGIHDQLVSYQGNHMGIYFLEMGTGSRPSEVTYLNRKASSFGESVIGDYDFEEALEYCDIVHICGIALMLSEQTREAAFRLAELAHEQEKTVCFDFNYRPSLNQQNEPAWVKAQFEKILPYCDIVIGGIRDLKELMEIDVPQSLTGSIAELEYASQVLLETYHLTIFAGTIRKTINKCPTLTGFIRWNECFKVSPTVDLAIVDRIGTGDAYAAGIITGFIEEWDPDYSAHFAVTNAVLAHTTYGDSPLLTKKQVWSVMAGHHGDVIR